MRGYAGRVRKKRDVEVRVCRHRSSGVLLLDPMVWHRGGVACTVGDAVEVRAGSLVALGEALERLLDEASAKDVDALDADYERRREAYRAGGELEPRPLGPTRRRLLEKYPALARGPGRALRAFEIAGLLQRPGTASRRLTRVVRAPHRGTETNGDAIRLSRDLSVHALGEAVARFLDEAPS